MYRPVTKEEALRSYGSVGLDHERMTATGTIEQGWSGPADIQSSLTSWYQSAVGLGATPQELRDAVEAARAERHAELAEYENEARAAHAVTNGILDEVAEFYGIDRTKDEPPGPAPEVRQPEPEVEVDAEAERIAADAALAAEDAAIAAAPRTQSAADAAWLRAGPPAPDLDDDLDIEL